MRLMDRDIVALTLWGEARGERIEGKVAVGCVIRNRLATGRWGSSFESVCRAPFQFSCWLASDPNQSKLLAMAAVLMRGESLVDPAFLECVWVADGIVRGVILPRVGRATHYYATSMSTPPAWAAEGHLVAEIGRHRFFEGVR